MGTYYNNIYPNITGESTDKCLVLLYSICIYFSIWDDKGSYKAPHIYLMFNLLMSAYSMKDSYF